MTDERRRAETVPTGTPSVIEQPRLTSTVSTISRRPGTIAIGVERRRFVTNDTWRLLAKLQDENARLQVEVEALRKRTREERRRTLTQGAPPPPVAISEAICQTIPVSTANAETQTESFVPLVSPPPPAAVAAVGVCREAKERPTTPPPVTLLPRPMSPSATAETSKEPIVVPQPAPVQAKERPTTPPAVIASPTTPPPARKEETLVVRPPPSSPVPVPGNSESPEATQEISTSPDWRSAKCPPPDSPVLEGAPAPPAIGSPEPLPGSPEQGHRCLPSRSLTMSALPRRVQMFSKDSLHLIGKRSFSPSDHRRKALQTSSPPPLSNSTPQLPVSAASPASSPLIVAASSPVASPSSPALASPPPSPLAASPQAQQLPPPSPLAASPQAQQLPPPPLAAPSSLPAPSLPQAQLQPSPPQTQPLQLSLKDGGMSAPPATRDGRESVSISMHAYGPPSLPPTRPVATVAVTFISPPPYREKLLNFTTEFAPSATLDEVVAQYWKQVPIDFSSEALYEPFRDVLSEEDCVVSCAVGSVEPKVLPAIVQLLEPKGRALELIKALVDFEVTTNLTARSMFRGVGTLYTALGAYFQLKFKNFLRVAIGPVFAQLIGQGPQQYVAEPTAATATATATAATAATPGALTIQEDVRLRLLNMVLLFISSIAEALPSIPIEIRAIGNYLLRAARVKFPEIKCEAVGGFVFSRFICPAIITPDRYGILGPAAASGAASPIFPELQAGLKLVTKVFLRAFSSTSFESDPMLNAMETEFQTVRIQLRRLFRNFVLPPPEGATPMPVDPTLDSVDDEGHLSWAQTVVRSYLDQIKKKLAAYAAAPKVVSSREDILALFAKAVAEGVKVEETDPEDKEMFPEEPEQPEQPTDTTPTISMDENPLFKKLHNIAFSVLHPRFNFHLKVHDTDHYISKDPQFSQRPINAWPLINFCRRSLVTPVLDFVDTKTFEEEQYGTAQISRITGSESTWSFDDDETFMFSQMLYKAIPHTQREFPVGRARFVDTPFPSLLPVNFTVVVFLQTGDASKTVECDQEMHVRDLINKSAAKFRVALAIPPAEIALKVLGQEQYLLYDDPHPVQQCAYIRESLRHGSRPSFAVVAAKALCLETPLHLSFDSTELLLAHNVPVIASLVVHNYYGGRKISTTKGTPLMDANGPLMWNSWTSFDLLVSNIPREARVCFTVFVSNVGSSGAGERPTSTAHKRTPLAWTSCRIFDHCSRLVTGTVSLPLLPGHANPIGICVDTMNLNAKETAFLKVVFPSGPTILLPQSLPEPPMRMDPTPGGMTKEEYMKLLTVISKDPLYVLREEDKRLLWKYRNFLRSLPHSIIKLLLATSWTDHRAVYEIHKALEEWPLIDPVMALELLDSKFPDAKVRAYAVRCLEKMSLNDLEDYMMQLVQALKCETYHNSPLALFLLSMAINNRVQIGHTFFLMLKAEIHIPEVKQRFLLLMRGYLRGSGRHRDIILRQVDLVERLVSVNRSKSFAELGQFYLGDRFPLPHDPCTHVKRVLLDRCRILDSARAPLWLAFENADPLFKEPVNVIFKATDDLRQDMLALQVLKIMNKMWEMEHLDMRLTMYRCVALGPTIGMIEVVPDCVTIADIQKSIGGGVTAAFKERTLAEWLRKKNRDTGAYARAVENFTVSCAGYAVATYLIGVGDRHNDNILLTKNGHLFHIDFGHILGNVEKWKGFRREKAPFVLTPEFVYIMGGRDTANFTHFSGLACDAYIIIRRHHSLFINLFSMMLSSDIPELRTEEDIFYLKTAFNLEMSEKEASIAFGKLISISLGTVLTRINNAIHIAAHPHVNEAHDTL